MKSSLSILTALILTAASVGCAIPTESEPETQQDEPAAAGESAPVILHGLNPTVGGGEEGSGTTTSTKTCPSKCEKRLVMGRTRCFWPNTTVSCS